MKTKKPKIGLALGSGGARGLSHIGVIKVLEEHGIQIDYIAGSSFGAWVGAWYARDRNIASVERVSLAVDWKRMLSILTDFSWGGGMVRGDKGEEFIRENLGDLKFSDLVVPLSVVTTDLQKGDKVVVDAGDVTRAVRASMSVPIIFKPVEVGGKWLADGGLCEPVPVPTVHAMGADIVIAVNLDAEHLLLPHKEKLDSLFSVSQQSFNIFRYNLARCNVAAADVVLKPITKIYGIVGWKDFLDPEKIIKSGEDAMKTALPKLKKLISQF